MKNINHKWWLILMAAIVLLPAAATAKPKHKHKPLVTVPEAGSALVYVVGAGMTCLGAMVVRARSARPAQQ